MSNKLLIIGAGGHGRVVASAAQLMSSWEEIAFLDDRYPGLDNSGDCQVIGDVSKLGEFINYYDDIVVAIGDNTARMELMLKAKQIGFKLVCVIHPSAQIAQRVKLGDGVVIFANAVINTGVRIGDGCVVNTAATIDHDCLIGDGVHVSPGVHIAGDVKIGDNSWIGIGASVIQGCVIGSDVIVGAGAAVVKNVQDSVTIGGVPAKELNK